MDPSRSSPRLRDRDVRWGRRVRAAVVLAGVLGSLGFAGYAASTAGNAATPTAAAPATTGRAPVTTWRGDDDGYTAAAQGAPVLRPGGGAVHATSAGSVHVPTGATVAPAASTAPRQAPPGQAPPGPVASGPAAPVAPAGQ